MQRYAHTKALPGVKYTDSRLWWLGVGLMILVTNSENPSVVT